MYCYCLFCETQRCRKIAQLIEQTAGIRAISPVIMQREWKGKEYHEVPRNWLPGYIFLYSDEQIIPYFKLQGIIRWVGNDILEGTDLEFAKMLYEQGGVMGTIRLVEEGSHCTIYDPLWEKMQGIIVKLDRGRKRCCVEFEFERLRHKVWIGYDLVDLAESRS